MEVRMETTKGLGAEAEVWAGGSLLKVSDAISPYEGRCPPGLLENVEFAYFRDEGMSWEDAFAGNRSHRKRLDPVRGWSYVGYGSIVSIMPVVIDFGLLRMEDPNWVTDNSFIGRYVRIPIDRLEIRPASKRDWPEGME